MKGWTAQPVSKWQLRDFLTTSWIPLAFLMQLIMLSNSQSLDTDIGYKVRFVEGTGYKALGSIGTIEVADKNGSQWTGICHSSLDVATSTILCRMLNRTWGEPFSAANLPPPTNISYVRFSCAGKEQSLRDCLTVADQNCSTSDAAAVMCHNSPVRFVKSGGKSVGYIELMTDSLIRPICSKGWDDIEADIVCKQMGYKTGYSPPNIVLPMEKNNISRPQYLNSFSCNENDTVIENCTYDVVRDCGSNFSPGVVVCLNAGIKANKGLAVIQRKSGGSLELKYQGGLVSSICNKSLTDIDVNVTCKGLGFKRGKRYVLANEYALAHSNSSQLISRLKPDCTGNESKIEECPGLKSPSGISRPYLGCTNHASDIRIVCTDEEIKAKIKPFNDAIKLEGRAMLNYDRKDRSICDPNWSDKDASVFCTQAGYGGGRVSFINQMAAASSSILGDVTCAGDEDEILKCPGSGWDKANQTMCDNTENYANVRCYDKVQLRSPVGDAPSFGFVFVYNVYNDSKWIIVCAPGWATSEARVTCRDLGYENGLVPIVNLRQTPRLGAPFPDFSCRGNETGLFNCAMESHQRCSYLNYPVAFCYNGHLVNGSEISLEQPTKKYDFTGAVKLVRNGTESRLCSDEWTDANANVTCRQIGFKGGLAYKYELRSMLVLPVLYKGMHCNGTETSIDQCKDAPDDTQCRGSAGVICYKDQFKMSIVDGNMAKARSSGFILMEYDNEKGHVCDTQWTDRDASVACKQMGFKDGVKKLPHPNEVQTFMSQTQTFIENVGCGGDEASLFMCDGRGWNVSSSTRCVSAGVTCFNDVRSDASVYHDDPIRGLQIARVQVFDNGKWGGVCGSNFKNADAIVFCKEVGFKYGQAVSPAHLRKRNYGSDYKIWIQELNCIGNESSILDCAHTNDANAVCPSSDVNVAAALCSNTAIDNTIASKFTGEQAGRLTVTRYGLDGKACGSHWNDAAATVVCRENGFAGGNATTYSTYSRDTNWLLKYSCYGNETKLSECEMSDRLEDRCDTTQDAGVLCYNHGAPIPSITSDVGRSSGYVTLTLDLVPAGVCTYGWGSSDAKVFCRSLKKDYIDGKTIPGSTDDFGPEPGAQVLTQLACTGSESSILKCPSPGWKEDITASRCGPGKSAAVHCFQSVRVEDKEDIGPVQVYFNNRWGYICDKEWDDNDAQVMCRQLGYRTGKAFSCSLFGSKTYYYSYVWSSVKCVGTEKLLEECPHEERLYLSCPTSHYASVMCLDDEPLHPAHVQPTDLYKLSASSFTHLGIVEFKYAGVWGRICPDTWDDKAAGVLCRELRLGSYGIAYRSASRTVTDNPFWMSGVECTGNEVSLMECDMNDFGKVCGCDITYSAGVVCYNSTGLELRLAGGSAPNEGRVEVAVEGRWGTVCDYGFGDEDASVICKHFNYTSGQAKNRAEYGRGKGTYWWTNTVCRGNETKITDCGLTGWDLSKLSSKEGTWSWSCPTSHERDAGVYCFGNVRLRDTQEKDFGRVEMNLGDKWFQVCDDGSFGQAEADIACRELGYMSGTAFCCSALGPSRTPSLYETATVIDFKCSGNESSIRDCRFNSASVCTTKNYMSVACSNTTTNETDFKITLKNKPTLAYTGQVEVEMNGVKGRICPTGWDDKDATVVCKQKGYKGGKVILISNRLTTPFVMGRVNCTGTESSLLECNRTDIGGNTGCNFNDYSAGVICYATTGIVDQLTQGKGDHGQIEIGRDGVFGTICSYGWSNAESRVYCRSKGYVDGTMYHGSSSARDKDMFISFVNCKGDEKHILQCQNQGWSNVPSYCRRYYSPVYVFCFGNVRLNNWVSYPSTAGAVEVYSNGEWNLVCDDDWDEVDAGVICKELGFKAGYGVCCNAYGHHYRNALFTKINCTGNEASLLDCPREDTISEERCSYATAICRNDTTTSTDYELVIKPSGNAQYTGRLSITYNGIKGRVCTDNWDDQDATVACKEMNYPYGQAYIHYESSTSILGGQGPWWITGLNCTGNETKLYDCPSSPWGTIRECKTRHTAGILCYTKNGLYYRMVNGGTSYGRIEVNVDGEWGTACDLYWDDNDARALCREFGFVDGKAVHNSKYGKGNEDAPVWSLRYSCNGTEDSLAECPHHGFSPTSYSTCTSHENDAGVQCFKRVRLDSDSSGNETHGPVMYHYNNTWFSICDDNFTDTTAQVICQSLGYPYGRALCCSAWPSSSYEMLNLTLRCNGQETDIDQCDKEMECNSQMFASVYCFNENEVINDTTYGFRFDNKTQTHGRIIATHWGRSNRICPQDWDDDDAKVFCRMNGYGHGIAYVHAKQQRSRVLDDPTTRPYILSGFNCTGDEKTLLDCPHRNHTNLGECVAPSDAGALCFNNESSTVEFYIVDGPTENQGRVEISVDGVRGTVCDKSWDVADAKVLCRQFGYSDGLALRGMHYGPGNGTIWLASVHCNGSEKSLMECPHEGWDASLASSRSCSKHKTDASVYCFSNVTIGVKPNMTMGVVRLFMEDEWNLVCEDSWTDKEALVACREIGQVDGKAVPKSAFGVVEHNITIPSIKCTGNENSLADCKIEKLDKNATCKTASYASAYCSNETIYTGAEFKIKFFKDDLSTHYYGIPLVRIDGIWGRICRNNFSEAEANITCKDLGYAGGAPYQHLAVNFYPIFMSNVSCTGNENSLIDCDYKKWGDQYACANGVFEAGVVCYEEEQGTIEYRLTGSNDNSSGRVEIKFNGTWGTVCDLGWAIADARVICSQFGYNDGLALTSSHYGAGTGPVWVESFSCAGNESSLLACPNSGWNSTWEVYDFYRCENHGRDASAKCFEERMRFKEYRLVGSETSGRGRVEVYITQVEEWGTICDDGWDDKDATVMCRYFNYTSGKAVGNARYGQGVGQIWLDELACTGNETTLEDCKHQGLGRHDCYHFEDAGVICSDPLYPDITSTTTTTSTTTPTSTSTRATTTTSATPKPLITIPSKSPSTTQTTTPKTTTSTTSATTTVSTTKTTTPTTTTKASSTTTTSPTTKSTTPSTTTSSTSTTTTPSTTTPTTTQSTSTPKSTTTTESTTTKSTTRSTTRSTTTTMRPTTTTTTQSTSSETNTFVTPKEVSQPPIAVVVGPLLAIFVIAVIIIALVVWWRQKGKSPFRRERLRSDPNDNDTPIAYDASRPDSKSFHFTNQLYDLSEINNELSTANDKDSDGKMLVEHDYLTDDTDIGVNPLYGKTGVTAKTTSDV